MSKDHHLQNVFSPGRFSRKRESTELRYSHSRLLVLHVCLLCDIINLSVIQHDHLKMEGCPFRSHGASCEEQMRSSMKTVHHHASYLVSTSKFSHYINTWSFPVWTHPLGKRKPSKMKKSTKAHGGETLFSSSDSKFPSS